MKYARNPSADPSPLPVRVYFTRCTLIGVVMAGIYSAWVTVIYLAHGSRAHEQLGTTLGDVILLYFVVGALGGMFVGLMWKLCRFRVFAYLTSLIVSALLSVGVAILLAGMPPKWDAGVIIGTPIMALAYGLWFGGQLRKGVLSSALD